MRNTNRESIMDELSEAIAPLMITALNQLPHHEIFVRHPLQRALLDLRFSSALTTAEKRIMENSHALGAKAAEMSRIWESFDPRRTAVFADPLAEFVNTVGRWLTDSTKLDDLSQLGNPGTPLPWKLVHKLLDPQLSNSVIDTINWVQNKGLQNHDLGLFRALDTADFFDNAGYRRPIPIHDLNRFHFLQNCFSNENSFEL